MFTLPSKKEGLGQDTTKKIGETKGIGVPCLKVSRGSEVAKKIEKMHLLRMFRTHHKVTIDLSTVVL